MSSLNLQIIVWVAKQWFSLFERLVTVPWWVELGFVPLVGRAMLRGTFLAHYLLVGGAMFPLCWLFGLSMQVAEWAQVSVPKW